MSNFIETLKEQVETFGCRIDHRRNNVMTIDTYKMNDDTLAYILYDESENLFEITFRRRNTTCHETW